LAEEGRGRSFVRRERKSPKEQPAPPAEGEQPAGAARQPPPAPPPAAREDRARIVVPRQERGRAGPPVDVELREVRWGATSRGAYLRVVPSRQRFRRVGAGHIEATRAGSRPAGAIERAVQAVKGVVLGSPFAASQAIHERLSKVKALAVFSSDALSSSAYATEEILLVLVLAGSGALHNVLPIGLVIAVLLTLVTLSYRQTIRAYPSGGGAYIVAHDNLGRGAGLVAAAALLVDYVLTVAVSIAAGVAAVTSAVPELLDYRVVIGVAVTGAITLGNLRGVRESGTLFAFPTYLFIGMMSGVIVTGLVKVALGDAPGSLLHEAPPQEHVAATQGLTLFLVLKAFSSGCAALTGVEAISNGVPAFKAPESKNARATLTLMAVILGALFLGITFLSSRFGFVPNENETIVSELGRTVWGENALYYVYQAATALVLFLAANTSYADFPRLSAILAKDRFMPRQFSFRGDRLAFSNGILLLAAAAAVLLIAFDAQVNQLIPLYALGVFVSFTLSQSGMVVHWLRLKESGWQASLLINGVGAIGTTIVAVIIGATKFASGAWISILLASLLVTMFVLIRRHYDWYERQVRLSEDELRGHVPPPKPLEEAGKAEHVIVPVDDVNKITLAAIDMAREISGNITAVHLVDNREQAEDFRERWEATVPDVPLLIIESPYRAFAGPMIAYIDSLEQAGADRVITVILPGFKAHHWWEAFLHNRAVRRLRPFLEEHPAIRIVDFDYDVRGPAPAPA
jgi:amino acid transporter